jgi:sec-independent protein translocase protein TatA
LIVAVVIIVLFGSRKLPHAARSLGQSMRILKREVQGLHEDEPELRPPAAQPAAPAPAELTASASGGQPATAAAAAAEASRPARQPS